MSSTLYGSSQPPRSRRLWFIIGGAVALIVGGWLVFGHRGGGEADKSAASGHGQNNARGGKGSGPVPVGVATVKTGYLNVYLNGLGTVTPRNVVTVHTRVDGQLMKVNFTEGQLVKQNDLLAELDARPLQAQLEQAEGALTRDQALLTDAKLNLERYQILFKQDSIAKQQLDTQASLVKQYEGAVTADQGTVDNAKVQVVYTQVTSPISGRVGLRQVDPGNIVHAADSNGIVVVTELQPITVIYPLPEDNIPAIMKHTQNGNILNVEAWDRDNKIKLAEGKMLAIDNQMDVTTGTVKFKAEFPNENNALFPNQFVNIRMLLNTLHGATLMPSAGIQRGTQGNFVYLVKDDKSVGIQTVKLGPGEGDTVAVTDGLKAGDIIVVDGADALRDGATVEEATIDGKPTAPPAKEEGKEDKGEGKGEHHHHKKDAQGAGAAPAAGGGS